MITVYQGFWGMKSWANGKICVEDKVKMENVFLKNRLSSPPQFNDSLFLQVLKPDIFLIFSLSCRNFEIYDYH